MMTITKGMATMSVMTINKMEPRSSRWTTNFFCRYIQRSSWWTTNYFFSGVDPAVSPARTPTPVWKIRAWWDYCNMIMKIITILIITINYYNPDNNDEEDQQLRWLKHSEMIVKWPWWSKSSWWWSQTFFPQSQFWGLMFGEPTLPSWMIIQVKRLNDDHHPDKGLCTNNTVIIKLDPAPLL